MSLALAASAQQSGGANTAATLAAGPKVSVGILPAYDASGEVYGEIFTQNLTQMLFDEVRASGYEPVLLNPGGAYTPLDSDLIKEFGQMSKVDSVLITILQIPLKPKNGPHTLKLDAQMLDPVTGTLSATRSYAENIRKEEAIIEGGFIGFGAMWGFGGTGGSRKFEKQPLGKRARNFARNIRQQVLGTVPSLVQSGTWKNPIAAPGSCQISFRVAYPKKGSISKSYGLIINGKEESLWLKEGVATVTMTNGPALLHINLADAPYRLPVQRLYAANTFVDCSRSERSLALDVGPAGEAFLVWQ